MNMCYSLYIVFTNYHQLLLAPQTYLYLLYWSTTKYYNNYTHTLVQEVYVFIVVYIRNMLLF